MAACDSSFAYMNFEDEITNTTQDFNTNILHQLYQFFGHNINIAAYLPRQILVAIHYNQKVNTFSRSSANFFSASFAASAFANSSCVRKGQD